MDEVNLDELLEAGFDQQATDYVQTMVQSFKQFIEEKRDELDALQIIYSMPGLSLRDRTDSRLAESRVAYRTGPQLTFQQLEALQAEILRTHPNWTTEALWNAYVQLRHGRRASGVRRLTDLITLIRAVVQLEDELVPYPDLVQQRYQDWLAMQEAAGHTFTSEQRRWLDKIAEQVGVNLSFTLRDFNAYFHNQGGLNAARRLFGKESLPGLLAELNESLGT
jgi:type I restriction enzyme R subunit